MHLTFLYLQIFYNLFFSACTVCVLQLCAAGRSQTLLVSCCLLIGPRLTTRGRTASGVSMWKRTSGSCLTSKCKRLHPGVRLEITQGGQRGCQTPDINTHTPLGYFPILCLIYADTLQNANRKVSLWLQSLIRFFFSTSPTLRILCCFQLAL